MTRMLSSRRHKLRPGSADAVEHWRATMNSHIDELVATLAPEGVNLEICLLERASDGDYLIYVLDCPDYDKMMDVWDKSTAFIDNFHRDFMDSNVIDTQPLEVVYWGEPPELAAKR